MWWKVLAPPRILCAHSQEFKGQAAYNGIFKIYCQ